MHHNFSIKPLTSQLVRKAYPFGQALGLDDFPSWRDYVKSHTRGGKRESGGIVAEGPHGYVCGLLFYRVDRHNKKGATLVCDPFMAADLPRRETPVKALLEAADGIAQDLDCRWVRIVVPANGDPLGPEGTGCEASLFRAGYALENLSFRRRPRRLPASDPGSDKAKVRQTSATRN